MGRLSKSIAGEVRLRFPSWKAWAFVSIALCPAFAGAGDARAQPAISVSPAMPAIHISSAMPAIHISPAMPAIHVSPAMPAIHISPAMPAIPSAVIHAPDLSATVPRKLPAIVTKNLAAKAGPRVRSSDSYISAGGALSPGFGKPGGADQPIGSLAHPVNSNTVNSNTLNSNTPLRNVGGTPGGGGIAGKMSKTLGGDTHGEAPVGEGPPVPRAYAPESYGSVTSCLKANSDHSAASIVGSRLEDSCNTVCGRYPYPPCH
jgi:hypothetical protein